MLLGEKMYGTQSRIPTSYQRAGTAPHYLTMGSTRGPPCYSLNQEKRNRQEEHRIHRREHENLAPYMGQRRVNGKLLPPTVDGMPYGERRYQPLTTKKTQYEYAENQIYERLRRLQSSAPPLEDVELTACEEGAGASDAPSMGETADQYESVR